MLELSLHAHLLRVKLFQAFENTGSWFYATVSSRAHRKCYLTRKQRDTMHAWQASAICKHVLIAVSHPGSLWSKYCWGRTASSSSGQATTESACHDVPLTA